MLRPRKESEHESSEVQPLFITTTTLRKWLGIKEFRKKESLLLNTFTFRHLLVQRFCVNSCSLYGDENRIDSARQCNKGGYSARKGRIDVRELHVTIL
jgi:hypothetical protein